MVDLAIEILLKVGLSIRAFGLIVCKQVCVCVFVCMGYFIFFAGKIAF